MKLNYFSIAIFSILLELAPASASIINVPGDQPTIQLGIIFAVDGVDEVVVAPGTYFETIDFFGKAITVRSTDPTDPAIVMSTIIDGTSNEITPVVRCISGEGLDTVLSGFVITGGNNFKNDGAGMINIGSSPTVSHCIFTGNTARSNGGGMYNKDGSNPNVMNCTFSLNTAGAGAGMFNRSSSPTVKNCMFIKNTTTNSGGGGMSNG